VIEPNLRGASTETRHARWVNVDWVRGLRAYLAVAAGGNLAWEILQLPLYTISTTGTAREIAFAVLHCAAGDVLIALAALTLALVAAGTRSWPANGHGRVVLVTLILGVGYTIFSEWLNVVVRANWAYSDLMPVVPILDVGLSPLLQWIFIPILSLTAARRFGV